jgi:hypothetical protein
MPSEIRDRIFDPFFTPKKSVAGQGKGWHVEWPSSNAVDGSLP